MFKHIKLLVLICCTSSVFAQDPIDSLRNVAGDQTGIELVKTFNELSWHYKNRDLDSADYFANNAIIEAEKLKDDRSIASAFNSKASVFEARGVLDSAKLYHERGLELKIAIQDSLGMADSFNNLGIIYDEKGDYSEAISHYFQALEIYEEKATEFDKVPMVLVNIGIVYKKQKEFDKVLEYYERALEIYRENDSDFGITITTGNIGSVLLNLKEFEESIRYSEEAMQGYKNLGYDRYVPYMLINMAVARDSLSDYTKAKQLYDQSVSLFEQDNNLYELSNARIGLGSLMTKQGDVSGGITVLNEALQMAEANGFMEFRVKALKELSKAEAQRGNYRAAHDFSSRYARGIDSLFSKEKTEAIVEMEAKYETEKKEKEIMTQRAELAEKELEVKRKNNMIFGGFGLAFVLALIGYLLYQQQKLKNRQLRKEGELKAALAKIETQNQLQEQRLRISRDLHDNIGAQLTFIISSLDNLKYGFKNMSEGLESRLQGISGFTSQTIYELRDTIWAMNKNGISLEDLQARITNFIDKAQWANKDTSFQFFISEGLQKDETFTSTKGMNIYRIIQEGVNNAMKYSEANEINVRIDAEDSNCTVLIEDNGIGFNMNDIETGNGLNNMKKRASDIGGVLEIKSKDKEGTRLQLRFPC
ncbi:sensor histidine kinase [Aureitalea sp. L0-47]|uniref:tetratricopeptide repeat-containing sensor histidine kinase n=1 Tax=Aureitalea sp. L0-47 TaxID=2816962 RepID=UPI0022388B89|nr:sensor histidine kinase [Aureitalea sp. L0-47]MCW5520017.1 sensor histidine kinase [Aureitalea sp. L0-47]